LNQYVSRGYRLSRRALVRTAAGAVLAAEIGTLLPRATQAASPYTAAPGSALSADHRTADALFRELDAKIEAAMAADDIPGVAVGVLYQGHEHVRGYGVTNRDFPLPVDGDTLFRIGSTAKTFTATTVMRLVEQGLIDLDAPVQTYLADLQLADASVAARVTVRQLLDHSAGWLGDFWLDTGRGADALSRYVAGMAAIPQLTPLGQVFSYNNAAVVLAGYLIEMVTGQSYEAAVQDLLLAPLGLDHSFFNADEFIGYNVAASHTTVDGKSVVHAPAWRMQRSLYPTGGLVSSARDQLRWARFHLSDGADIEGPPVLSVASLQAMHTNLGPGGTIPYETGGVGVNWWLRLTAEDVPVWQHNGDWAGQHASLFFVPDHGFAFTALVNSDSGNGLLSDLSYGNWVLERFAGLHNPPAEPQMLSAAALAPYEGRYVAREIDPPPGDSAETTFVMRAADGGLRMRRVSGDTNPELDPDNGEAGPEVQLTFYRDNYVVVLRPQRTAVILPCRLSTRPGRQYCLVSPRRPAPSAPGLN
jgi:CubicO group peptidase (beta-lactamase class C family)